MKPTDLHYLRTLQQELLRAVEGVYEFDYVDESFHPEEHADNLYNLIQDAFPRGDLGEAAEQADPAAMHALLEAIATSIGVVVMRSEQYQSIVQRWMIVDSRLRELHNEVQQLVARCAGCRLVVPLLGGSPSPYCPRCGKKQA